jgi:hypothetical protein
MIQKIRYKKFWFCVGLFGLFIIRDFGLGAIWENTIRSGGANLILMAVLPGIIWVIIWQMDPDNPHSIIKDGALTQYDQTFVRAIGEAVKNGHSSSGPLTDYDRTRAEAIAAAIRAKEADKPSDQIL